MRARAMSAAMVGVLALCGGVQAAEPIAVPAGRVVLPVYDAAPGFDWNGFYAGVFGVLGSSGGGDVSPGAGVALGVNTTFDFVLAGAEVTVAGLAGDADTSYAQLLGRAGVFLSDDVMLYAAGGFGIDMGAPDERSFLVGAGLEMAVTDDISLRAQYLRGIGSGTAPETDQVAIGANFHF